MQKLINKANGQTKQKQTRRYREYTVFTRVGAAKGMDEIDEGD